jgi:predicted nucleotidyltransferase
MKRDEILGILAKQHSEFKQFRVKSLALFGSVVRDEAQPGSDLDILVEFEDPATFDGYMELKFFLEDLMGCRVDLVTRKALKPRLRNYVEQQALYVT